MTTTRPPAPLSLSDRAGYALIGAVFGAVMGGVLLFAVMVAFALPKVPVHIVAFSAMYFAAVGFAMGAFVGEFVGAAIGGLLSLLAWEPLAGGRFTDERTFRPLWIGALFVLWLVAAWLIYLRT